MGARRRNQWCQPLDQFMPLHHDMGRPISPTGLESIGESAVGHCLEPIDRKRQPSHIATQTLEPTSVVSRNSDIGVQAHPAVSNATGRDRCVWLHAIVFVCSGLDAIPETTPPLARFGSGRDPRSDGGGTEHSHQRVVADEGPGSEDGPA